LTSVKSDCGFRVENADIRARRALVDAMTLTTFRDLLDAAHGQPEPQRLLFVFARADLPESHTPAQRERYERRQGGTLSPCLCVDKAPSELDSFDALAEESSATGQAWDIVFVASLSGRAGIAPAADEAAQPLRLMVNAINGGRVHAFAAFDRNGNALRFS
jgi:hypothetical protein